MFHDSSIIFGLLILLALIGAPFLIIIFVRVCEMARRRGIETIVDGAHSFARFDFKQADLGCDYFGTFLHKWLYAPKGIGLFTSKNTTPIVHEEFTGIRITPNVYTTLWELDRFCEIVAGIDRDGLPKLEK